MLIGKNIKLRYFESSDLDLLMTLRPSPDSYDYFFEFEPINTEMQRKWWEAATSRPNEKNFIIAKIEDNKPIGTMALVRIDFRNRNCEVARLNIAQEFSNQGFAKEAFGLSLEYAFNHLNMHKLYGECFSDNEKMLKLLKDSGLKQEGLFKNHIYKKGVYKDVVFLAICQKDFRK